MCPKNCLRKWIPSLAVPNPFRVDRTCTALKRTNQPLSWRSPLVPKPCGPMRTGCPLMMRWSLSDFEGIFDFWEQRSEFPRKVEIQETQLPQFRSWYVVSFKVNFQSTEYKLPAGGLVWKTPDFFEPCDRNELACSERALATYETCKNKQAGYNSVIWNVTQEIAVVSWGKTRIARSFGLRFS